MVIKLSFPAYPVRASLGVVGRKWALLVLMKLALGEARRFNELLRSTPGMSKRILAIRLHELEQAGFIVRAPSIRAYTRWKLTEKGADLLPVLLTLIHFESRWRSREGTSEVPAPALADSFEVAYLPSRSLKRTSLSQLRHRDLQRR